MKHYRNPFVFAFLMVASLFFVWGFCHAMLDVLNKHFQNILSVSKAQSGLVQTSVFGAYLLMALPAALLGGAVYLLGSGLLGPWALLPAALVVTAVYAAEAALGIVALGKLYERLDPSSEGVIAA